MNQKIFPMGRDKSFRLLFAPAPCQVELAPKP